MSKLNIQLKYSGFTLIELLVVMSIMVILSAMSVASFGGLRNSIILNEGSTNIQQTLRNAQRSAMLLKRDLDERWIYGIGVDFSTVEEDGDYKVFKWCSPFQEYGDQIGAISSIYATSKFPNYNPSNDLDRLNGNLPVNSNNVWEDNCEGSSPFVLSEGVFAEIRSEISTVVEEPTIVEISEIEDDQKIVYVVFESISGRAFLYNQSGLLMNYDVNGNVIDYPNDFSIQLITTDNTRAIEVSVSSIAGKISLERISTNE